jgi:hypothetical protein
MPRSSHPQLDHSNYTWRRVQVMQFPPPSSLHPPSVHTFSSVTFKADESHSILLPPGSHRHS